MSIRGICWWWDDAVTMANDMARATGTRMVVKRHPRLGRWIVTEAGA